MMTLTRMVGLWSGVGAATQCLPERVNTTLHTMPQAGAPVPGDDMQAAMPLAGTAQVLHLRVAAQLAGPTMHWLPQMRATPGLTQDWPHVKSPLRQGAGAAAGRSWPEGTRPAGNSAAGTGSTPLPLSGSWQILLSEAANQCLRNLLSAAAGCQVLSGCHVRVAARDHWVPGVLQEAVHVGIISPLYVCIWQGNNSEVGVGE